MGGRYGLAMPILFLRGSNVQKLPASYRSKSGFGDGKYHCEKWWRSFGKFEFSSGCCFSDVSHRIVEMIMQTLQVAH